MSNNSYLMITLLILCLVLGNALMLKHDSFEGNMIIVVQETQIYKISG